MPVRLTHIHPCASHRLGGAALVNRKPRKKAEPISLIDFDDEAEAEASPAATGSTSSNPMDDLSALSSLSLGGGPGATTQTSARPSQIDPMSLFSLDFSSSATTNGRGTAQVAPPLTGASGAFFSNPAYGQAQSSGPGTSGNLGWGTGAGVPMSGSGSASGSGRSTPNNMGGAISLGKGGMPVGGSRPTSAASGSQQQQQPPRPPPKKDAFEDLLGDF